MPYQTILSSSENENIEEVNLKQGKELIEFTQEYEDILQPHLQKLQLTTAPNISSIVEALNSVDSVDASHVESKEKMYHLEKKFNRVLSEYARTNDQVNELLLQHHHKGLDTYNGMIVTTDGDKNFIYVNDYGFTHKYPKESHNAMPMIDASCEKLKRAQIKESVLERIEKGRAMVPGEPCGVAGKNIHKENSDEYAWVSIDGLKHIYPSHVWNKKKESCNVPVISLKSAAYDAIPSGTAMTTNTECEKGSGVPPALWKRLYKLNEELEHLTELLSKEVDNLNTEDMELTKQLIDQKTQLSEHNDSLKDDREKIVSIQQEYQTVVGINEDTRLQMQSNWLHYIVWIIFSGHRNKYNDSYCSQ